MSPRPTASAVPVSHVGDGDHHGRGEAQRDRLERQDRRAHAAARRALGGRGRSSALPAGQHRAGLADGDHRAGDEHARRRRAGRRRRPRPRPAWSPRRCASASRGATVTRSSPKTSVAVAAELLDRHRAGGGVLGDDDVGQRAARSAASRPSASLSPITPITPIERGERERVLERGGHGLGAVRVVRGVEHDRRAAPDDLEPAGRGDLRERRADQLVVERLRRRRANASTAASATAAFCAWWAPYSGRNTSS